MLRLAPKITVATTTTIASAPPTIAERTGAAFEPLPGSTAKRIPVVAVGDSPERVAARASLEPRGR